MATSQNSGRQPQNEY